MQNKTRKFEMLVNVAIVVVAVAVCAVLPRQYLFANTAEDGPEVGSKIELPGVDFSKDERALVLVLQKDCRFCTESGPFYQRLAREAAARGGRVKLYAVLPDEAEEGRRYVEKLGVPVTQVTQARLAPLQVTGTPTLILLERGTISHAWVGALPPERESEVLAKL
jgi:hypothetical protein